MSDTVSRIEEQYRIGFPKFVKLFNLSSAEISQKLSTCGFNGDTIRDLRNNKFSVTKIIKDDEPYKIELWNYDHIEITPFGIVFFPDMGNRKSIVDFSVDF